MENVTNDSKAKASTPLTFEELPLAVTHMSETLTNVERLLLELANQPKEPEDRWFNLSEICEYLPDKPVRATVYGLVSRREIPFHKHSKKLFFLKSEIDNWLKMYRKKTTGEIKAETDKVLENKRKG